MNTDSPCAKLIAALHANIKDPSNLTWRAVLEALEEIERKDGDEVPNDIG